MSGIAGKVWLIGAGPGDPGLFTLAGAEALAHANVVIYDALANTKLLNFAPKNAELIYVGKIAGKHALPQEEINALLADKAKSGAKVARLKGGDPYIFGRGGEEAEYLAARQIEFEEIPGISSAISAPAYAGIPLTHRDLVSSVSIITGHEKPDSEKSRHDWEAFVKSGATLVFLMGMKNLPLICRNLIEAGMDGAMPAAVIYRGATPMQRKLVSTLVNLPQKAEAEKFTNPSVIVIGKVVSLSENLDWFSAKPLLGKTIVVTRAREQASDISQALANLGAEVIEFPTIRIKPLEDYHEADEAIRHIRAYDWIIFTSVNGVKYFWERLAHNNRDARTLGGCKIAAIGPATALALENRGIRPDLLPKTYVAESVAETLIAHEGGSLKNLHILVPRALKARSVLPDELEKAGAKVKIAPVYETVPDTVDSEELKRQIKAGNIDCITFASSSTVSNFFNLMPVEMFKQDPKPVIASIGPITSATLAKVGIKEDLQAKAFTIPDLVETIKNYYAA